MNMNFVFTFSEVHASPLAYGWHAEAKAQRGHSTISMANDPTDAMEISTASPGLGRA
jgi:hypothetical protein